MEKAKPQLSLSFYREQTTTMLEAEADMTTEKPVPVKKDSFTGDVLKLVSGTASAQVLAVLIMPIVSRLYAPDAFGLAAIFISIANALIVIACLRYELAIMLPERDEDAVNVLAVSLSCVLMVTGGSVLLVFFARTTIIHWLNVPDLALYLWMVPLAVLFYGAFLALNYWSSRTKRFGRLSIARASTSATTSCTQLVMGVIGHAHAGSLIGAVVLGSAVSTTILGGQSWRDDRQLFLRSIRLECMIANLKRYRKFPLLDSWGGLINTVAWQLPVLLLSIFFSQTIVGYYALTNRVIQLPLTLIGGSIAQFSFKGHLRPIISKKV
jgi:lipopolysaccharide exporter